MANEHTESKNGDDEESASRRPAASTFKQGPAEDDEHPWGWVVTAGSFVIHHNVLGLQYVSLAPKSHCIPPILPSLIFYLICMHKHIHSQPAFSLLHAYTHTHTHTHTHTYTIVQVQLRRLVQGTLGRSDHGSNRKLRDCIHRSDLHLAHAWFFHVHRAAGSQIRHKVQIHPHKYARSMCGCMCV
jgi:hypothetical protein